MIRSIVAALAAFALVSTGAFAKPAGSGSVATKAEKKAAKAEKKEEKKAAKAEKKEEKKAVKAEKKAHKKATKGEGSAAAPAAPVAP